MKLLRYLLLTSALLFSGCNSTAKSNEPSIEAVSSSEPVISSEIPSSSKYIPEEVINSEWGQEAALACYETLGTVVPYYDADAFEYEVVDDDYGDPAIWFYLYYETQDIAEAQIEPYAYEAWQVDGYECTVDPQHRFYDYENYVSWTQKVLFADKNLSEYNAVEIQALASQKPYNGVSKGCLGLFCFNYVPNLHPDKFPVYAVSSILGENNSVPQLNGNDLEFGFQFFLNRYVKCLEIYVTSKSAYYELEEEYFYLLLQSGFVILQYDDLEQNYTDLAFMDDDEYPEFDDNLCYYAAKEGEDYIVYFDYDLNRTAFYIDILPSN